jgi:hypothetical protein
MNLRNCIPSLVSGGLSLVAGCATSETDATAPTWHRDVRPIVETRCATCHTADSFAPFPLQTYGEVQALRAVVAAAVSSGEMPP